MLIDTHCHLTFKDFKKSPRAQNDTIHRAHQAGVSQMITVGVDLDSGLDCLRLARQHESVFCALGIHPNEADNWDTKVGVEFLKMIQEEWKSGEKNVVAIGEIGLDYYRLGATKEEQKEAFRMQLQFAKKVQLPVIVHCRDAFDDVFRILEVEGMESVVFHCFSGDLKMARQIWANDWHTSFTATVTYPGNDELEQVVALCPEEKYFLETDSPFLAPEDRRGQKNEPAYVVKVAKKVADIKGQKLDQVAWQSTQNAAEFFRLPRVEENS